MEYRAVVKRKSDNELMHYKYIKRERGKNGKWRYYYDVKDALGYDERKQYQDDKAYLDMYTKMGKETWKDTERVYEETEKDGIVTDNEKYIRSQVLDNHMYYEDNKKHYEELVKRSLSAYENTPLYKVESAKERINSGVKSLKKILGKLKK